jgi:hypothetical protein
MADPSFQHYLSDFAARHRHPANRTFSFVGDHLVIAGVALALFPRVRNLALLLTGSGIALILAGHLVFDRNLSDELRDITRHPLWAARADARMIRAMYRRQGTAFADLAE